MSPRVLACALAAAALALLPGAAGAQRSPTVSRDCRPNDVASLTDAEIGETWMPYHPGRLLARLQPLITAGRWGAAMDSVVVRGSEAVVRAPAVREAYLSRLEETRRRFAALLALPAGQRPAFLASAVRPTQWQPSQNAATGNVTVFAGSPGEVVLRAETPSDERRAVCWPALAVHQLLASYDAPGRDETVRALEELAARWERYVDDSYSQLPWELAVNSLSRSRRDWEPPRRQWVLLHPSVGVEVAGLRRNELQRVDVAVLEGAGLLFYNGDYTRYVGISGVGTFARDRAPALGGYLHLWFPQAKLGYLRRPHPDPSRRSSLLVSIDLYDVIAGVPRGLREARDAALAGARADVTR